VAATLSGGSGLWTTEDFVFIHEDDYQGNHEERNHRPAQEIEVAGDIQHWNLHCLKVAGDIHVEKDSGRQQDEAAENLRGHSARRKGKITYLHRSVGVAGVA
jgi:hypothetical protein